MLTCLMSALALVLALLFRREDRWLCFAAMALSSVGDILLMNFNDLSKWLPGYFWVGAVFFMGAHVVYMFAFGGVIRANGWSLRGAGLYCAVVLAAATFAFFTFMTVKSGRFDPLNYALFIVYLLIISLNCAVIFTYSFNMLSVNPWRICGAVGALSFFLSDCIIGMNMLAGIGDYGYLIWWLYPIGQILIIIAA